MEAEKEVKLVLNIKNFDEIQAILNQNQVTLDEAISEFLKTLCFYKKFPICVTSPKSEALNNAAFAVGIQMTGGSEPSNFGKICTQLLADKIITLKQSEAMIDIYYNKGLEK